MLNEVPAAAKHKLGPTAVQSEPRAPPDLLKHSPFYISAAARVCKLGQKRQNGSGVGLYLGCQGPECPNQHEKTETLPREGALGRAPGWVPGAQYIRPEAQDERVKWGAGLQGGAADKTGGTQLYSA